MFLTGFQHEDAAVFFNNLRRDFLQAIWANGGRRFNDAVESEISPREFDVRRRNVYEISGSIQVISQMIKVKVAGVAKTSGFAAGLNSSESSYEYTSVQCRGDRSTRHRR